MYTSQPKISPQSKEVANVVCCLEFLAAQTHAEDMLDVHSIIRRSIDEINQTNESTQESDAMYSSIIQAFKVFAKFCLMEDKTAKKDFLALINNLDRETLRICAVR